MEKPYIFIYVKNIKKLKKNMDIRSYNSLITSSSSYL